MGMKEGANTIAEMNALAERAAADLIGTCRTLHELGEEYEAAEDSTSFCARLDELAFCCNDCSWWCEQSECCEVGGEWLCEDCAGGYDNGG